MLILIAHGSRDPRWRASVEKVTAALQAELGANRIGLAYMDCTPPTLMEVASEAVRLGARRVRVLPLFLATEGHVERDVLPLVAQVRATLDSLDVEVLPPVGQLPLFRELLRTVALEAGPGPLAGEHGVR
jgi:sirohydrochlorin cobaltochelatase